MNIHNKNEDKEEFNNAIDYFKNITYANISKLSEHKMGATFIGIKTNISGKDKLHIYIILLPFVDIINPTPYSNAYPNIYIKDISLNVDDSFYLWVFSEMRKQNSIVIMSLDNPILKVVEGFGDLLVNIDKNCNEKKEWDSLDFDQWYNKKSFDNIFTIKIINPHLYMVPFPLNSIILKTQRQLNNYCDIFIGSK